MKRKPIGCQWFLNCDRPSDGVVKHSILGNVPCCQRCADKLKLDLVKGFVVAKHGQFSHIIEAEKIARKI